jgi:RNA polymerase sigma-70 factor (ECF subfamily)
MENLQSSVTVLWSDLNPSATRRHPRLKFVPGVHTPQPTNLRDVEFDAFMAAHQEAVLRTARRLLRQGEDAKDAAQEVFLRLLRSRSNVQGDLGAWLYRVTVNVCNDYYRRRRPTSELRLQTADPAPGPECLLRFRERTRLLREGLNVLTKRERAAVVLRDIKGFSAAEVGAMLEIREVTVRRHIHSARTKLAGYVRIRI